MSKFLLHPWAIGLYAVALFGSGYAVNGWRLGEVIAQKEASVAKAERSAQKAAQEIERLMQQASDAVAIADQLRTQKRRTVREVVVQEVVKYVQSDSAGDCGLDADGVRIHNLAAAGELPRDPESAREPDERPGPATAAEIVQVVTANYDACLAWRDQVRGWIEWRRNLLN